MDELSFLWAFLIVGEKASPSPSERRGCAKEAVEGCEEENSQSLNERRGCTKETIGGGEEENSQSLNERRGCAKEAVDENCKD